MGHKPCAVGSPTFESGGHVPPAPSFTPLLVGQILHLALWARDSPGSFRRGRGAKLPDFYIGFY